MNILMAKGASHDSVSSVRPSASEASMDIVHVADLPVASLDPAMALQRGRPAPLEHADPTLVAPLRGPSSGPIDDAALTNADDDLKAARGFMNAVLFALPLWGLIALLVWFFLAR
jgi:hypothetical protein